VLPALALGCSLLRPLDELEEPEPTEVALAASGASCERDGECSRDEGRCLEEQHLCQPCPEGMQQVSFGDGLAFCIDRFETTQGEYNQFLSDLLLQPTLDLQEPELCPATESFEPGGGADCLSAYDRGGDPALPMVCVDLCDAMAYCNSRGKRLCGGRGGVPLDRTRETVNKPNDDEWLAACMGREGRMYPYGDVYEQGRCNVDSEHVEPGAAFRECETPEHVRHLSGNVAEWVLVCNDDRDHAEVHCLVRGGEHGSRNPERASCELVDLKGAGRAAGSPPPALAPADVSPGVGIRCCMD
jgi:formylglycine-generating enzyme required for sulfatase activity